MLDKKSSLYTKSKNLKNGWNPGIRSARDAVDTVTIPENGLPRPTPQPLPEPETFPIVTLPAPIKPPIMTLPAPLPEPAPEVCGAGWCNAYTMASVRPQTWEETYEPAQGFERGTIFPQLDFPFIGEGACRYE